VPKPANPGMASNPLKIKTHHQGSFNGRVGKLARSGRKARAPGGGLFAI